jgi:hypothetical protein
MNPYRTIELYIMGKLNPDRVDELWVEFLKEPVLFEYFDTLLHLSLLLKEESD